MGPSWTLLKLDLRASLQMFWVWITILLQRLASEQNELPTDKQKSLKQWVVAVELFTVSKDHLHIGRALILSWTV